MKYEALTPFGSVFFDYDDDFNCTVHTNNPDANFFIEQAMSGVVLSDGRRPSYPPTYSEITSKEMKEQCFVQFFPIAVFEGDEEQEDTAS